MSPWEGYRRILHCDLDCFYAAVHMRDDPSLRGRPIVIGGDPSGRGVVAAASYEARSFGIHSALPAARAQRLCPEAVFLRPDFPRYRRESQAVFQIFRAFSPLVQAVSIDEAYLDVSDTYARWGSATGTAREIRRRVREERGLTVSVGVGPNRLVAKIASDTDKPDGLTVVKPAHVLAFLDPLPVRKIPGIGPATDRRLEAMGVRTIADLRGLSSRNLAAAFGRHGKTLYEYARGIDKRPVRVNRERKSLSSERTFASDLTDPRMMIAEIERMSAGVAEGLAKRGLTARTVTLKVRFGNFETITRSRSFRTPTADGWKIESVARDLLHGTEADRRSVRLIGVGASNLILGRSAQLALFDEASVTEEAGESLQGDAGSVEQNG